MLGREGADAHTLGRIFVAVVQAVLLCGSDMWVMTPRIVKAFDGFHNRVCHSLMGSQPRKGNDKRWVYPLMLEAMEEVGLQEVDTYFSGC